MKRFSGLLIIGITLFNFSQCSEGNYINDNFTPELSSVNSDLSGLEENESLLIRSDAGDLISMSGNGQMYLADTLIPVYSVTNPELVSSPDGKNCSLNPESTPDGNIQWTVNCVDINYYHVGVNITGLEGSSLGIQLNDGETGFIQNNGEFVFPSLLQENSEYSVKIISMPENPEQLCSISNYEGIIKSNISDMTITCASNVQYLSGYISGPHGSLSIKNSNGEILQVPSQSNSFSFSEFLPENYQYTLTIESQPTGQECYILKSEGKVKDNTGDIEIICNDSMDVQTEVSIDDALIDTAKGNNLELWFYTRSDQIVYPLFKKSFIFERNKIYNYKIPYGQYFVRGFIDNNDSHLPEIGPDYQSRPYAFFAPVSGEVNRFKIDIEDTSLDTGLSTFNAYVMKTPQWHQPAGGKCGGEYLFLEASGFQGNREMLSELYVLMPGLETIQLLDDGGCGNAFSNESASYDRQQNDNVYSAGIDLSNSGADPLQPGEYIFYYLNYYTDKITIIKDSVSQTEPLSSLLYMILPNGETPVSTPRPLFEWNPVPGAASYEVLVETTDHSLNNFDDPLRFVKNNFYLPAFDLPDQSAYRVTIRAYDRDMTGNPDDFDMVSQGPDNFFITDFTGTNSVTISGRLVNNSGTAASYMIYADGNSETGNWESSAYLTSDKETYSLSVLKNTQSQGTLLSSLNVDESGYLLSEDNKIYSIWRSFFQRGDNISLELSWNMPVFLTLPENFTQGTGEMPYLSWEQYETPIHPFSYVLWLRPVNNTANPVIIGLTSNYFDFRYIDSSSYVNLGQFYTCTSQSQPSNLYYCSIDPESKLDKALDINTQWEWHVQAVSCSTEGVRNQYSREDLNNYTNCILESFTNGKNIIGESQKRLFSSY